MAGAVTDWITAISTAAVAVVALFFGWTEWHREHERDKGDRRARSLLLRATLQQTIFSIENEGDSPFLDLKLYFYVVNGQAIPKHAAEVVRQLADVRSPLARIRTFDALAEMAGKFGKGAVAEYSYKLEDLRGRRSVSTDLSQHFGMIKQHNLPSEVPDLVLPFWYLEYRDDRNGRWTMDESGRISEMPLQRSVEPEFHNAIDKATSK